MAEGRGVALARSKVLNNMWLVEKLPDGDYAICSVKGDLVAESSDEVYANHIITLHNDDVLARREAERVGGGDYSYRNIDGKVELSNG